MRVALKKFHVGLSGQEGAYYLPVTNVADVDCENETCNGQLVFTNGELFAYRSLLIEAF